MPNVAQSSRGAGVRLLLTYVCTSLGSDCSSLQGGGRATDGRQSQGGRAIKRDGDRAGNDQSAQKPQKKPKQLDKIKCFNCGAKGHMRQDCPKLAENQK